MNINMEPLYVHAYCVNKSIRSGKNMDYQCKICNKKLPNYPVNTLYCTECANERQTCPYLWCKLVAE
jgi:hypothetical protein